MTPAQLGVLSDMHNRANSEDGAGSSEQGGLGDVMMFQQMRRG